MDLISRAGIYGQSVQSYFFMRFPNMDFVRQNWRVLGVFFFGLTYSSLLRKLEPAELWSKKCNRLRPQVKKRPTNFNQ